MKQIRAAFICFGFRVTCRLLQAAVPVTDANDENGSGIVLASFTASKGFVFREKAICRSCFSQKKKPLLKATGFSVKELLYLIPRQIIL